MLIPLKKLMEQDMASTQEVEGKRFRTVSTSNTSSSIEIENLTI